MTRPAQHRQYSGTARIQKISRLSWKLSDSRPCQSVSGSSSLRESQITRGPMNPMKKNEKPRSIRLVRCAAIGHAEPGRETGTSPGKPPVGGAGGGGGGAPGVEGSAGMGCGGAGGGGQGGGSGRSGIEGRAGAGSLGPPAVETSKGGAIGTGASSGTGGGATGAAGVGPAADARDSSSLRLSGVGQTSEAARTSAGGSC